MKVSKYSGLQAKQSCRIKDFERHLKEKGYARETIRSEINYAANYLDYLQKEQILDTQAVYKDLLTYIESLTSQEDSPSLINRKLSSIRKYYVFLSDTGIGIKNPAEGLYLKNKRKRVPSNLLSWEELSMLYENYQVTDSRSARNKVIVGLLVFEGLTREEIEKLEVSHINLHSGKIEVPSGKHRNGRILQLEYCQMRDMQTYLHSTREEILASQGRYGSGRKPQTPMNTNKTTSRLFISMHGTEELKNSFLHLMYALRKLQPKLNSAGQIRQSVITHHLKTRNLREVQYMAGHRYVSSTERYERNNLEDLQNKLQKFHPLNHSF